MAVFERSTRKGAALCLLGVSVVTAALCTARPAHAEFEAGAFAGYYSFSEKNRLGRYDLDPPGTSYVGSPTLGARLAYLPIQYLSIETQISVVSTSTKNDRTAATILHLRGHLVGNLPIGRFRPFVLVGAGAASITPADPLYIRRDTDLNFHAGAGVRFEASPLWGVRAELQSAAVPRTDQNGIAFDHAVLVGLYGNFPWPPTPPLPFDKDKDDITDDKDECPDKAGEIRFGGCPDPDAKEEEAEEEEEGKDKDGKDKDGKDKDGKDGDAKPGDAKPGDTKPGDTKPGDAKDTKPSAPAPAPAGGAAP